MYSSLDSYFTNQIRDIRYDRLISNLTQPTVAIHARTVPGICQSVLEQNIQK
jgi:hypothetical protein